MEIFTILGSILDGFVNEGEYKIHKDDNVIIPIVDTHIIAECLVPLCDNTTYIGKWYVVFGKNPCNENGEIISITHCISGKEIVFNVREAILNRLSSCGMDGLYFDMCNEIIL